VLAENAHRRRDVSIASGGGRMKITMDRYDADWAWSSAAGRSHVHGEGRQFASAREAIETFRSRSPMPVIDQDLPGFVIAETATPVGPIRDGDAVVFFNFRGDRAIEISRAFEERPSTFFDRGPLPRVFYAGMMQYDGDLKLPARFLVVAAGHRPHAQRVPRARTGISQLRHQRDAEVRPRDLLLERQPLGQVRREALETYVEIPSDVVPFDERPWMKAAEITDA
jgi:2,3-bisphosphoglycerate-independent phosphoglycerate mutase